LYQKSNFVCRFFGGKKAAEKTAAQGSTLTKSDSLG